MSYPWSACAAFKRRPPSPRTAPWWRFAKTMARTTPAFTRRWSEAKNPTRSPDGRQIAFTRYSGKLVSIYIVPALGGTERLLYRGTSSIGSGISWSPGGKFIAFSESKQTDPTHATLSVVALADSSTHALTSPPAASLDQ